MKAVNTNAVLILLAIVLPTNTMKTKRSIDLSASHPLISDIRLPTHIVPKGYTVIIRPNIESSSFAGTVKINVSWTVPTRQISLHAHYDLQINEKSLRLSKETVESGQEESNFQDIPVLRGDRLPKKTVYVVYLRETVQECSHCILSMDFEGGIWKTQEGLFKASFTDIMGYERTYLVTNMKPNNARRLFPCFDEPGFKVPFEVSIARPKDFVTLFNTQLLWTEMQDVENSASDYVIDHFEITPPMSTFTFGFVTAQLEKLDIHSNISSDFEPFEINMWGSRNMVPNLDDVYTKLTMIYKLLVEYFNSPLPVKKIDVLALPGLPLMYPSDNWGLLIFKETELFNYGYYHLAQELIYQWLGSWITPEWWNDLHVNKALTSFLAANIAFQIDDGHEFNEKYPMTILYSLYYEFSKRYPHSRITGMKHETTSYKTELVIRMLNYTLGHRSFQAGLRKFVAKKIFTTYTADDLWNALTEQAIIDSVLPSQNNIANIANSWISKDRLPVINVERNYIDHLATITQKVYLRERPHDVPDRDKMLWWIPLVVIEEGNLNFSNTRPRAWMPNVTKYILHNVDENEKFIIVNPEEIGPFPVNYDAKNWNRLSTFLQTESGLQAIPAYTRAKLLHDAWNLAYAGDLSFATAFNMTLFMKFECDHLVWNPVFTFIDHIGRHIDISDVHIKFEAYVRHLLTPLYNQLSQRNNTERGEADLLSIAETFLCRAGYKPCIDQAQQAFKLWMEDANPDQEFSIPTKYICPVLKWGTTEEWRFGLMRFINFPKSRKRSDRTFLLKNLVRCPMQSEKINLLLHYAIIDQHNSFTENDVVLIFNMLTGGSNGYKSLFNFLSNNWSAIKQRYENNTNLWDSLISSATGMFTTEEGYNMVKKLYDDHKHEFKSALHIIEKSMRNIKEEAKWSEENLPVIENWLTKFFDTNQLEDI